MSKTIVIAGYGPGISASVARKFGAEGFKVALVARRKEKLDEGVVALREEGVEAQAFPCDLGDAAAVRALIGQVREALGPITVIHWNAYAGVAGDLLSASDEDLLTAYKVGVGGVVAAVQEALPDLRSQENAALLITGGGFAFYDPGVDKMIVQWGAMGLALAKAAQHKLAGILHERLKADGVYVGEVIVLGLVKGTAFDQGGAGLDPAEIAEAFFRIYTERSEVSVKFPG